NLTAIRYAAAATDQARGCAGGWYRGRAVGARARLGRLPWLGPANCLRTACARRAGRPWSRYPARIFTTPRSYRRHSDDGQVAEGVELLAIGLDRSSTVGAGRRDISH